MIPLGDAEQPRSLLDPDPEQWQNLTQITVDFLTRVLTALPQAPAFGFGGVETLLSDTRLQRRPSEHGRPLPELLAVIERAAASGINPSSPGCMAFIPGSGLVSAALGGLIADVLNRYTGMPDLAPGLVTLEADLLQWLAEQFSLPGSAAGILTSGGSLATFSALVAARHDRLPDDFRRGTLYVSDQVNHAVTKSARLAGFPASAIRTIPSDAALRMDPSAVAGAIAADRARGLQPFCVVASAGTTNTGAIDPLPELAQLCAREDLWFHVDGAYGAAFVLTNRGRQRLTGIEHADSIVLDPHKGFFLPFGTGCLLVRDGAILRAAHSGDDPEYLQDHGGSDLPDFGASSPELSRSCRGLRLWLPLHLHGVAAFRDALDQKLDLAQSAYAALCSDPGLHVPGPPALTVVAFRCVLPGGDPSKEDDATAEVLRRVNAEGRVVLSSTRVGGRYVGRISILNHRTDQARVDEAVRAIRRHVAVKGRASGTCR